MNFLMCLEHIGAGTIKLLGEVMNKNIETKKNKILSKVKNLFDTNNIKKNNIKRFSEVDLYPVISSEFTNGRDSVDVLKSVLAGKAKVVQLREKNISKDEFYSLACEYRKITKKTGTLLIINDHVDIALAVKADGVHLGQDDLPIEAAKLIAPDIFFGVSTHDLEEVIDAQKRGADYINIGPIYSTQTKTLSMDALGVNLLKELIHSVNIPFSVMGGIKQKHLKELISVGATRIAMVTEITKAKNITKQVCELRKNWS